MLGPGCACLLPFLVAKLRIAPIVQEPTPRRMRGVVSCILSTAGFNKLGPGRLSESEDIGLLLHPRQLVEELQRAKGLPLSPKAANENLIERP